MAIIYNSDLTKELVAGAAIQQMRDSVPNQIAEKVVPTMEVNPFLLKKTNLIVNSSKSTTGNGTVYTTLTDRDTYLTGINLHMIKDVTCDTADGTACFVSFVQGGQTKYPVAISGITLTAQNESRVVLFANPVKLDRGSVVQISGTFTAGKMIRNATIFGYTVETNNA